MVKTGQTANQNNTCGSIMRSSIPQVIGPKYSMIGDWPWMASIGYLDLNKVWKHQCGATLISDRLFLTAAHCAMMNE